MSLLTEVLDRLSGIAIVRARLEEQIKFSDELRNIVLDHEKRLIWMEAKLASLGAFPKPTKLTTKTKNKNTNKN